MFPKIEIDESKTQGIPIPAQVADYVRILGLELTVEFILSFGGSDLYIPENPKDRSELEALIGTENTRRLGANAHLLQRRVPLAKRWIAAVFRANDIPTSRIARCLRVTDSSVRSWLNK